MKVLVDTSLRDHPKLAHLAELLHRNPAEASGYLLQLWAWCMVYRQDGSLEGLTEVQVASAAGFTQLSSNFRPTSKQLRPRSDTASRFVSAMLESGWLDRDPLQVHDWHEHEGRYIEKIKAERARKRRGSSAEVPRKLRASVSVSGSGSVSGSVSVSGKDGDKDQKSRPPIVPRADYGPDFLEAWSLYPRREGKGAAWKAWRKSSPPLNRVKAALAWQARTDQWTRDGGQFIPHMATWINRAGWEDEPTEVRTTIPEHKRGLAELLARDAKRNGGGHD